MIFAAMPWPIFQALGGDAAIDPTESFALAVAAIAAAITLGVQMPDRE